MEEHVKELQKLFMPEDTEVGVIQAFLDEYDDDFICTRILYYDTLNRTGEMKQWESKELSNIMNNAIVDWEPHRNHRFKGGHGTQRSWKRIEKEQKKKYPLLTTKTHL